MTNVHADWFEVTEPLANSTFTEWLHHNLNLWAVPYIHARGLNGYRERIVWGDGVTEQFSNGDERMGRHWTFSGASWDKLAPYMGDPAGWRYFIRKWAELGKGNVTRIDLASDFHQCDARTVSADIIHGMNEGLVRKRSWTEMTNSSDGYTMYFGSRRSDVMLRCYDKGAQLDLKPFEICRTEFEIKKNKSRALGDGLRGFLRFDDPGENQVGEWLAKIAVGLMVEFLPVHTLERVGVMAWGILPITLGSWLPKPLNNDAWWWNVVIPALQKRVILATGEFDEVFWNEFISRAGSRSKGNEA